MAVPVSLARKMDKAPIAAWPLSSAPEVEMELWISLQRQMSHLVFSRNFIQPDGESADWTGKTTPSNYLRHIYTSSLTSPGFQV
jgi:hypothetical protein